MKSEYTTTAPIQEFQFYGAVIHSRLDPKTMKLRTETVTDKDGTAHTVDVYGLPSIRGHRAEVIYEIKYDPVARVVRDNCRDIFGSQFGDDERFKREFVQYMTEYEARQKQPAEAQRTSKQVMPPPRSAQHTLEQRL
jgi:hypothetical protein